MTNLKDILKDIPGIDVTQFREQLLLNALFKMVILYREMHNRAKGKPPCMCGVCQMAQQQLVEDLGIDLTVYPQYFSGGTLDEVFKCLEMAGEDQG